MNYNDWLSEVPSEITDDALWQSEVYRFSLFVGDLAWYDTRKLIKDRSLLSLANQLLRAAGSISVNIAEGYSYTSGKNQARYYEYALGSARETRDWYFKSRMVLGREVTGHRLKLLTRIIRQLLGMIRKYRNQSPLKEEADQYETVALPSFLENAPMPE